MFRWLNDLRIARKVAIAPIVAVFFLVGLGLLAGSAIRQMAGSFDMVVSDSLPKANWLTTTRNEMQATQTRIFRSLLWQSSNAPEENQARARQDVVDQLERISDTIARGSELFNVPLADPDVLGITRDRPADMVANELAVEAADLPEREAVRNLFWAVQLRAEQYAEAVERVRAMQTNVFTAAVTFAGSANQTFESLTLALDQLQNLNDRESARQRDSVEANSTSALSWIVAACVLAIIVLGLISFTIGNRIARPIQAIAQSMRLLAQGNTAADADGDAGTRKDEVGEMATALRVFRDNAQEVERLSAAEQESRQKAAEQRKEGMRQLAAQLDESVNSVVGEVRRSTDSLKARAESMVATADETSAQSQTVANSSQQASANVDNVSQAAQRLAASIDQINSQVQESARIAAGAVDEAERTDETVKGLSAASHKIGDVVSLINDIAEQTNLLALNATIEAARAGDAGKGFAVVASEVKNLANQTAKATEEIGREIDGIKSATAEAVAAIQSIGGTVRAINGTLGEVAVAVDQQREATADISRNGSEAASGTNNVSHEIDGVRNAATRTGEMAGEVRETSDHLAEEFRKLNRTVEHLIEQMRAA